MYPRVLSEFVDDDPEPRSRCAQAALELPETEERLSHGQPTFFVAGKQFAQFRDNHHGDHKTVVCVRISSLDEQAMLLEADPGTYSKPAYLAVAGSRSTLPATRLTGAMSPTGSRQAGSLRRRGGCSKLAGDERIPEVPPPLGHLRRNHRRRRAGRFRGSALWITWKNNGEDKPTEVVEQRQAIPLTCAARPRDDGAA